MSLNNRLTDFIFFFDTRAEVKKKLRPALAGAAFFDRVNFSTFVKDMES